MKLWLDDERAAPDGWIHANNVTDAKCAVTLNGAFGREFEACSLDHDLGDGHDGIEFVDWMVESGIWPTSKPVVHSMNPVGKQRMLATIERYFPS